MSVGAVPRPVYCRNCQKAIRSDDQGGWVHYLGGYQCRDDIGMLVPDTYAAPEPEPGPPPPPEWPQPSPALYRSHRIRA
jgi:hypothetical protein